MKDRGIGDINLKEGIIPVTKAAATLAELIRRARSKREHIVLTQNGKSAAVLLDIDEYVLLRRLAEERLASLDPPGEAEVEHGA